MLQYISKNKKRKLRQPINKMHKLYLSKVVLYCIILISVNYCFILIAKFSNLGFTPYPPLIGLIIISIFYSLLYWILLSKLNTTKANFSITLIPSIFYILLIGINPFASWDLIYLINELLNYPLCILKFLTESVKITTQEINEIVFYIVLPIFYQVMILVLLRVIEKRKSNCTAKL